MRRLIILLLVGAMALTAGSVHAKATRTPFTAMETTTVPGQPERLWTTGHILHIRGQVDQGVLTGDLVGSISTVVNLNVSLETGRGTVYGPFVITTADVTWEGHYSGTLSAAGAAVRFVGQGTDGTKIMGTATSVGPTTFLNEGFILDPHG